jgi:hypothetical protein
VTPPKPRSQGGAPSAAAGAATTPFFTPMPPAAHGWPGAVTPEANGHSTAAGSQEGDRWGGSVPSSRDASQGGGPPAFGDGHAFPSFSTWDHTGHPGAAAAGASSQGGAGVTASAASSVGDSGWGAPPADTADSSQPPAAVGEVDAEGGGAASMYGDATAYGNGLENGNAAGQHAPTAGHQGAAAGGTGGTSGGGVDMEVDFEGGGGSGGGAALSAAADADPFGEHELTSADPLAGGSTLPAAPGGGYGDNRAAGAAAAGYEGYPADWATWTEEQQQQYYAQMYYHNQAYGAAGGWDGSAEGYDPNNAYAADPNAYGSYYPGTNFYGEQYAGYAAVEAEYSAAAAAAAGEPPAAQEAATEAAAAAVGGAQEVQQTEQQPPEVQPSLEPPAPQAAGQAPAATGEASASGADGVTESGAWGEGVEEMLQQQEQQQQQQFLGHGEETIPGATPGDQEGAAAAAAEASADWEQPQQHPPQQDGFMEPATAAAAAEEVAESGWEQLDELDALVPEVTPGDAPAVTGDAPADPEGAAAAGWSSYDGWQQPQEEVLAAVTEPPAAAEGGAEGGLDPEGGGGWAAAEAAAEPWGIQQQLQEDQQPQDWAAGQQQQQQQVVPLEGGPSALSAALESGATVPPHLTRSDGGYEHLFGITSASAAAAPAPAAAADAPLELGYPDAAAAAQLQAAEAEQPAAALEGYGTSWEAAQQQQQQQKAYLQVPPAGYPLPQASSADADSVFAQAQGLLLPQGSGGAAAADGYLQGYSQPPQQQQQMPASFFATVPAGAVAAGAHTSSFLPARASTGGYGLRSAPGPAAAAAAAAKGAINRMASVAAVMQGGGSSGGSTSGTLPRSIPSSPQQKRGSGGAYAGSTGGGLPPAPGSLGSSAGSARPSLAGSASAETPHALIIHGPVRSRSMSQQLIPSSPHATSATGFFIPGSVVPQGGGGASAGGAPADLPGSSSSVVGAGAATGMSSVPQSPRGGSPLARSSRSSSPLGRANSLRTSGTGNSLLLPAAPGAQAPAAAGAAAGAGGPPGGPPPMFWIPTTGSGSSVGSPTKAAGRTSSGFGPLGNGYLPGAPPAAAAAAVGGVAGGMGRHLSGAFGSYDQVMGEALVEGPEGEDDAESALSPTQHQQAAAAAAAAAAMAAASAGVERSSASELASPMGVSNSWQDPRTAPHAYDRLIQERLRRVDWRGVRWQQPGKLGTPKGLQRLRSGEGSSSSTRGSGEDGAGPGGWVALRGTRTVFQGVGLVGGGGVCMGHLCPPCPHAQPTLRSHL